MTRSSFRLRPSSHQEWLSMLEVSGPFLAVSVLEKIFPQGLESLETYRKKRIRSAYEEWCDAVEEDDPQLPELHQAWVELVLHELLEYEDSVLKVASDEFIYNSLDGDGQFKPNFFLKGDGGSAPMLFVSIMPDGTDLEKVKVGDGWPVPILERMTLLCRDKGVRLGLVTNGERWMLVNAPVGSTSSHVSWYARLWFQEPVTLKAFQSLLGVRRWFGPKEETLPAILEDSLQHHEEVTDTLGEQVKRAVEVLVQCLDKADQDRNRELLHDVPPAELYEAGLTVMMRLVFVLCAEERGLLLLDDPIYDQHYAITTLRGQLAEEADQHGHEVLERRHDAWTRLLAVFRAVYGGIEHESLRMPALGGSLFDPDRFPFLEGRAKGTHWQETPARPLPIDNRTVLLLLEALQVLEQRGGALLLSYKALDVEQIGHVYEGLLEHTVGRLQKDTLGLIGSQKAKNPNIALTELESARLEGLDVIAKLVKEKTLRSLPAIKKALQKEVDDTTFGKIVTVCGGDMELAARLKPFAHLLRIDAWGDFIVYRAHSFAVTLGADRRETGTHYTPKSLTESIVETTLEPVAYVGPAEGKPREEWQLKSSAELLELKICDPAMGSGAFLVQVCRWLSERLVEAWGKEAGQGKFITVDGVALESAGSAEPMPDSLDERLLIARRLVAEKCLYGVDLNPLAVELAKLSIWLITLAKGRPFGFLDHNLRSGDSLLGLHRLEQLTKFSLHPEKKQTISIFASNIKAAVTDALALRKQLRETPIRDIRDVQYMERLDRAARQKLEHIEHIADAMIGEALASGGNQRALDIAMDNLSTWAAAYIEGDNETGRKIVAEARKSLSRDLPVGKPPRKPFHWALEFPEVFERGGFDGIVGNPPWGSEITTSISNYYKSFYSKSNFKLINTFKFFIERMSFLSSEKAGVYSFLVPTSLLEHIGCKDVRSYLLEQKPYLFVDCGDGMFSGVNQSCCYGIIGKGKAPQDHLITLSNDLRELHMVRNNIFWSGFVKSKFSVSDIIKRPNVVFSPNYEKIHTGLGWCQLKDVANVFDSGIDYSRKTLGDAVFYSSKKPDSELDHKVLKGRNINKYEISFDDIWLRNNWHDIQDTHRKIDKKSRLKVNDIVYESVPKILVRQTGDKIICTMDYNEYYHQKSLLSILPIGIIDPCLICAYLNHPKTTETYQKITMQTGKVFSQVKKNYLEQIPIPAVRDDKNEGHIIELVKALTSQKLEDDEKVKKIEELNSLVSIVFSLADKAPPAEPNILNIIQNHKKKKKTLTPRKKKKSPTKDDGNLDLFNFMNASSKGSK